MLSQSGVGSWTEIACANNNTDLQPPLPSTQHNVVPSTPTPKKSRRPTPLLSPVHSFTSLLHLSTTPSRPITPSPLRISQVQSPPRTPTLALSPLTATAEPPTSPFRSLLFSLEDITPTTAPLMPSVHQPKPTRPAHHHPAESPTHRQNTAMPSRPSSRSEKLLRETLLRDTDQRPPMPYPYTASASHSSSQQNQQHQLQSSSPTQARSSNARHRRRHSEVPGTRRDEDADEDDEVQMMRGAMLFRSPAAPPFDASHNQHHAASLARRHSHTQHQHQTSTQPSSPILARRASVKSNTHPRAPSPATSHHTRGISRSRVPPSLPLDPHHRHPSHSSHSQHYSHSSHHTTHPSSHQPTTPNEQLLRQRLERVLQVSGTLPPPRRDVFYELDGNSSPDSPESPHSPSADDEYTSHSYSSSSLEDYADTHDAEEEENAVMDENGGRVWRGRGPLVASPPGSSSSSGSRKEEERGRLQARSRTEPILPAMQSPRQQAQGTGAYPQRPGAGRSVTAPGGVAKYHPASGRAQQQHSPQQQYSPQHTHQRHNQNQRSNGTTPPLVSDGSGTPPEDEDSDEVEDGRLLTPPHSPYHHYAYTHGHGHPAYVASPGGYVPSPYVNKQQLQHLGQGRKPQLAPYEEDGDDDDDFSNPESEYEEGGLTTAQRRAYIARLGSQPGYPSNPAYPTQLQQQQQHQFNARRASAKCREMDGYVSFAAVEGLGAPPDLDTSGSSDDDVKRRGGVKSGRDARREKEGVVGGWVRRLWGSEGQVVV